ncbi:uncharacterized protein [Diadema antillarum]|uniref:uncharacterized protein n=1 Tax=Diadema antillarum TaxID=105358 RepID=UPI003A8731EF
MNNQRPSSLAVGDRKNRVVRGTAGMKRRKGGVPLSKKVALDRVLGLTVKDNSALTCDPNTGYVAYPAGCAIVVFNPRKNKQFHILNHSKKTLTALAFSGDGRYLASGECGHNPAVRIWDVQERTQVTELVGHKFGIACVAFSPDMRYVVSIGEQHDMVVNVWDWKKNTKHSSGKVASKITGLSFSEDGSSFVAVGNRCVKFWYLAAKSKTRQIHALSGRSGILGEQRNNFFCSIAHGRGENRDKVYVITKSGFLCEINSKRLLDKWVEVRTTGAHGIVATEEYVFVACDSGVIRLFNASTLHFIATLPRPHYLGVNVSAGIDASHMLAHKDNAKYPDAIAITFDDINKKLTCVYNDHSLYMWDLHDLRKIGKQWSFLYHSACIFDLDMYPELSDGNRAALPAGSFLTCSSDCTIRIWNVDPTMNTNIYKRNIYSHELLKVLYVGEDSLESLQDGEPSQAGNTDKVDTEKGKTGIRCVRVSPDGQTLASGDRSGNVRVHDLQFWDKVHEIEAHDSEVLCLEYTQPSTGYNLLASASRDRLIHVFDMDKNCSLVQTLDDHSSSITSVKFNKNGEQLQMISCGADKALMFRMAVFNPDLQFVRNHHVVSKTTLYDLAIDTTQKYITTACQDRSLRIYNVVSGKLKRTYKGAQSDEGTLIRVELDPSGIYAATSCSDKSLSIYDFYSGECVATMMGHSELVTGIKFTSDCKQLISVSGDGCIFVWKLPWELTHNMKERLREMGEKVVEPPPEYNILRRGTYVVPPDLTPEPKAAIINAWQAMHAGTEFKPAMQSRPDTEDEMEERQPDEGSSPEECNFDAGLLPLWAQKQVNQETTNEAPSPTNYSSPTHPRGRWAQNINDGPIKVKSQMEMNQSIELRLEDCFDRRRYTVEPDVLLEQVRPFASRSRGPFAGMDAEEIAKICGDEFVPASQKFGLQAQDQFDGDEKMTGFVTTARGSDPFVPPMSLRAQGATVTDGNHDVGDGAVVEDIEGDDEEDEEEEEEEKDDDAEEKQIIFYPPEEEASSSPESLKFQVTESTQSHEELAKRHSRHRSKDGSRENLASLRDEKKDEGTHTDTSTSNTEDDRGEDESDEDDEEDEEEVENITPSGSPTRKLHPMEPPSPTTTPDEEKFLHTNFSFAEKEKIGDFTEQEKFGRCLEQLQSRFASADVSCGRLSISSRFLSRSQQSISRLPAVSSQSCTSTPSMSAEEYLRRRKEEVARAVEETRKRLTSLGWNVGEKKLGLNPSAKASSLTGVMATKPTEPPTVASPTHQADSAPKSSASTSETNNNDTRAASPIPKESTDNVSIESPAAESSGTSEDGAVKVTEEEEKCSEVHADKNRFASKENSQDSSPDTGKNNKNSSTKAAKITDSKAGPKNTVLDEVNRPAIDPKTPESLKRQASFSSEETQSCDNDAELDSNKENLSSVSLLNKKTAEISGGGAGTKSQSGGERSKPAGKKSNMRRVASLNDLRKESLDKNESSPVLTAPSQPSGRSSSTERERKPSRDSPARQKRRDRAVDRMLPLLPMPKTKSYEARTESSMAKVVRRISESPPPSPNTLRKRSVNTNTGSPKLGPMKAIDPSFTAAADVNDDLNSEDSVESTRTGEDVGAKPTSKDAADKLAMPPPASTHVSKTKPSKKNSASKMSDRGRRRSQSTSSSASGRARRASTSSLPPDSSESKAKPSNQRPKGAAAESKKNSNAENKATSSSAIGKVSNVAGRGEKGSGSKADDASKVQKAAKESKDLGRAKSPRSEPVDDVKKDAGSLQINDRKDEASSSSEDTMVLDSKKGAGQDGDLRGVESEKAADSNYTSEGATSEEEKAMRADLRIDLDDITVTGAEEDPGAGLRRSVEAMKTAFDQCLQYVSVIEKTGNHLEDLRFFQSAFSTIDKTYTARVHPLTQSISDSHSPENTLSDVSEGALQGHGSQTSRSMPSLSDLLSSQGGATSRGRRPDRAGSLDASSPQALALLQHYSDMLVSMVRTKMEDGDDLLLTGRSRASSADLEPEV